MALNPDWTAHAPPLSSFMSLQLNGKPHLLTSRITLSALLDSLGLGGKPVVAELNGEPVLPRNFPTTPVQPGDTLEIITLAAGG
jgi:sulfur carrier protein